MSAASRRDHVGCVALALGLAAFAIGCATPGETVAKRAAELGLQSSEVQGAGFRHVIFSLDVSPAATRVHVYIGGDGSPAQAARYDPPDPTPRNGVVLDLMTLDPAPRLALGRPCYHGMGPCDPIHFTLGRYGEPVVASMVAALSRLRREHSLDVDTEWVLIGFSGGGTLAVLMAERLPNVRGVVTIAGNLDIEAWSRHHEHPPLRFSLNPIEREPLPSSIVQIHLRAGRDANVTAATTQGYIARQSHAQVIDFPEFDHGCCWREAWPLLLLQLDDSLSAQHDP